MVGEFVCPRRKRDSEVQVGPDKGDADEDEAVLYVGILGHLLCVLYGGN